ncbi:MAG: hypothetical protein LBR70_03105 [Lactobacillaceae bacterium]|jgi:hypothetical protein|nr:hypothetical protein [Lactobacillaceae bacterium]
MQNFSKQFAIINKIKSIVKRKEAKAVIKSANQETISQKIANRIQQTAFEHLKAKVKKEGYTAPYIMVAEQLGAENNQIFCAAVYTLSRMAINSKAHRGPILDILSKSLADNSGNREKSNYISKKLAEINKNKLI